MSDSRYVTKEMYVPSDYVFLDAHPRYAVIIHKTASPGMSTAEAVAQYFVNGSDGRHVSSHYVVGKDGTIVQCVREKDGSGANAGIPYEEGRNTLFSLNINWNLRCITIEHVDDSIDNSQPLTVAQQNASFKLVRDICTRLGIASTHIAQHSDIQPKSKPRCAGNYPIEACRTYRDMGATMGVKLNSQHEVIDIVPVTQFLPSKTEFACGFFSASMVGHGAEPGKGPGDTEAHIQKWALDQYIKEYGSDGANKTGGVSVDDMHRLLIAALTNSGNSHYFDLPISASSGQSNDIANIKGALASGYPVVCTVSEASIIDKELGKNPYFWGASGNHVFVITGIDANGDFIVHDPANIIGSFDNNVARPQPRHYDHTTIDISWASMCRVPWLVPFPSGWNPVTSEPLNQIVPSKPVVPTPTVNQDDKNAMVVAIWNSCGLNPIPPRNVPAFIPWRTRLLMKHDIGTVRSQKYEHADEYGDLCDFQNFDGGICIVRQKDGNVRWL
jgi:uncharacterized protein YvpB